MYPFHSGVLSPWPPGLSTKQFCLALLQDKEFQQLSLCTRCCLEQVRLAVSPCRLTCCSYVYRGDNMPLAASFCFSFLYLLTFLAFKASSLAFLAFLS